MIKEIAFTAYPAIDVSALEKFYSTVLGLTCTNKYEEDGKLQYAEYLVGTSGYFSLMTNAWSGAPKGSGSGVAFEVDDIEKTLKDLAAAGIKTEEPYDTPVCRVASINDPEGNKVTFHQTTVPH